MIAVFDCVGLHVLFKWF